MTQYNRSFTVGRGSELLYNEELHMLYELIRHLPDSVTNPKATTTPTAKMDGSLWHDRDKNDLKWYDKANDKWRIFYENRFKIVSEMMSTLPPGDPIRGQLWIHQGVLCYFDGTTWTPIQALVNDGSQFSLDVFKNFILVSPLWKIGNTIVKDDEIEAYKKAEQQYLQNVLDSKTDAHVTGDGTKWKVGEEVKIDDPKVPVLASNSYSQLLVPQIDYDRVFLNDTLDSEKYEEVSKVCIQYKKTDLVGASPSLVHINPGRMNSMKKRLVKIDRANPKVLISAANTEFYGFKTGDIKGSFLRPDESDETLCDYTIIPDGILLSYNASQNFDYVLAVTYDFSWIKSTGTLSKVSNQDTTTSYYINNYNGPMNVFIEGFNLEEPYYSTDSAAQTITMAEDTSKMEFVAMHAPGREYGYIRQVDLAGRGILHPLKTYVQPLVFINGEALSNSKDKAQGDFSFENGYIYVPGAKRDMAWSVVELYDEKNKYNAFYSCGDVTEFNVLTKTPHIAFDTNVVTKSDNLILFIDGLLVKNEDMKVDYDNGTIVVDGLTLGQEYILLRDKYGWLYNDSELMPAMAVGKFTDSLVYYNGHLLCNNTAIDTLHRIEEVGAGAHNEVKCFKTVSFVKNSDGSEVENVTRSYKIYDAEKKVWNDCQKSDIDSLLSFAYSYENATKSIKLSSIVPYTSKDKIVTYAYNLANDIENPLVVRSIDIDPDSPQDTFNIDSEFVPGTNSLMVWVNGVRQYPNTDEVAGVHEGSDGRSFTLPEKISGRVTYVIEKPEKGSLKACSREILGPKNMPNGQINIYKTNIDLYPGRIVVYINGVRQPQDLFTAQDNHTLMINDSTQLIGNYQNYPKEKILDYLGNEIVLDNKTPDYILVEVRQDDRKEKTIELKGHPVYDLFVTDYGIEEDILEAADEIMIYADGLYFGARSLDGYRKNLSRGTLTITQDEIISTLNKDEQYEYLTTHQSENQNYIEKYGKPYKQYDAKLTLEWR